MIVCPSCGQENPDGFRLCGMCGTRYERKENLAMVAQVRPELEALRRQAAAAAST